MVKFVVPAGVAPDVLIVKVELPAPAIVAGLKEAVVPPGRAELVSGTLPVNPFSAVTVTV